MFNKRCTESIIGCLTWKSTPDPGTRDGIARRSLFMHKLLALLLLLRPIAHAGVVGAVLESLRDRRPDHYAKVRAILKVAETRPAISASQWIEARAGASDVELLQW